MWNTVAFENHIFKGKNIRVNNNGMMAVLQAGILRTELPFFFSQTENCISALRCVASNWIISPIQLRTLLLPVVFNRYESVALLW